jgi:phosphoribosyl-ATP pyrophosphohydrolase/phosphoribosyl-AMP cyclohydrolase
MKLDSERALTPVVVQDDVTGEIRMLAWADEAALERTRTTKRATFFSRSRNTPWVKGETSGHWVEVHEVRLDCDQDAALYLGRPNGPTCHTGAESCFFASAGGRAERAPLLLRLEGALEARKTSTAEQSYTKSLYEGGALRIGQKLREEADELARAIDSEADSRVVSEAADVVYHLMVGLRHRGIAVRDVLAELDRRFGRSGHEEKAARGPKTGA